MKTLIGSIFGTRIRVIGEAEDSMDCLCICPHCGCSAKYGDMMMISGISCCPKCNESLYKEIIHDKEHDYKRYTSHDYEPFGIRREK